MDTGMLDAKLKEGKFRNLRNRSLKKQKEEEEIEDPFLKGLPEK